jgi:hypothetical protein
MEARSMNNAPKTFPEFTVQTVDEIIQTLPKPLNERRRQLLPQVLQEWRRKNLISSLPSNEDIQNRFKKQDAIKTCAQQLLDAIQALDEVDRASTIQLVARAEGRSEGNVSRSEYAGQEARLREGCLFLQGLSSISPEEHWKTRSGQPRNYAAYLILQDAAVIFEWYTAAKPARGTTKGKESGPFFRFASVLWPIIFGSGTSGLPAAMKNWALWRKQHQERSALIANIDIQHPTWGLYED